ncbi:MAG: hypothetical protein V2B19_02980 [Pseudomonadota bacterium]
MMTDGKKICAISVLLMALLSQAPSVFAVTLWDWGFNINGSAFNPGDTVPALDAGGFDWSKGLGALTFSFKPGTAGHFYLLSFFDHETGFWDDEFATAAGAPGAGQSWEIDEPGYVFGDIYGHFRDGILENTNAVDVNSPDDVSMAMGWDFGLLQGQWAVITLLLGEERPAGFYLSQTDPDSDYTFYFSGAIDIRGEVGPAAVPEPGTIFYTMAGVIAFSGFRDRRFMIRRYWNT